MQADELARGLLRHFAQTYVGDVVHAGPFQLLRQIRLALPLRPGPSGDMAIASSCSLAMAKLRTGIPPSAVIWTDGAMYRTATFPC